MDEAALAAVTVDMLDKGVRKTSGNDLRIISIGKYCLSDSIAYLRQ